MARIHLLVIALVSAVSAGAAETGFWQQLTPEERRAAGLDQLSPEQRRALDGLAERFAREGVRQVREEAKQEVRAEVRAEAREEVKQEVREEVKREMTAVEKTRAVAQAGLPAEEPKDLTVRSRALGKFHGWSGDTVFRLENGQVWVQTDPTDSTWLPPMEDPEVEIRRSGFGGWKLYLGGKSSWVRVRRLK
ncbi:MAG TPA: hypothetical protein VLT83_04070 [Opitutaceae bacterium]|nr:hypothetical protein [Opitutaceae bacterium]